MTITFALSNQIISRTDSMILASGSKNYVTAQFDLLTEDWTAPITAIFNEYTVVPGPMGSAGQSGQSGGICLLR